MSGVGLAAAVGQLELPHGLVAPPGEPRRHVLHQLAQRVGGIGEREELLRLLVDRPPALRQRHLVEVRGELGQGQLARPQLVLQPNDLVPGLRALLLRHGVGRPVVPAAVKELAVRQAARVPGPVRTCSGCVSATSTARRSLRWLARASANCMPARSTPTANLVRWLRGSRRSAQSGRAGSGCRAASRRRARRRMAAGGSRQHRDANTAVTVAEARPMAGLRPCTRAASPSAASASLNASGGAIAHGVWFGFARHRLRYRFRRLVGV